MAPLSVLPGRVRFESNRLTGNEEGCRFLEQNLIAVPGVTEASASHRTGRVLVLFDEALVSRSEIEEHLERAFKDAARQKQAQRSVPPRGESSSGVGHFFMEMALHAFLPAPLDLLLPTAATVFRR